MRILSTRVHGVLDYLMALALIALPWLGNFERGGPTAWVPMGVGAAVLVYSLLTDYELGLMRKLPMTAHLWLDALGGLLLIASPWIFGFDQQVWIPHVAFGAAQVVASFITDTIPGYERRRGA